MDTRTQFLDQFDNPYVRAAAEKALNRRTINLEATGLNPEMAQGKAINELNDIKSRSFSALPGKTDAIFNSGGNENLQARNKFLSKNSKSFGDWDLQGQSTQWIAANIHDDSRLAFFEYNSALLAQNVALDPNVRIVVPFTEGLTQAERPKAIWPNAELPAMLHEVTQGADPNIVGVSGKHIVDKIGASNIDKPEVVYPLSKALGEIVKDGKRLDTSVPIGSRELHSDPARPGEFIVKAAPHFQEPVSFLKQVGIADAGIAVTPGFQTFAKGTGVVGAGLMVYDAVDTERKYTALSAQGNQFGADALLHDYVGRTSGGVIGGFAAGAAYGAATGSWTGPGALVTGAVGGAIGAFGGEALARAYTQYEMNHQVGDDGHTYAYANGKWGSSNWIHQNQPAPQDQIATLEYKRVSAVTELALANPQHLDTQHIALTDANGQKTEYNHTGNGWSTKVFDSVQVPNQIGMIRMHDEPVKGELGKQLDQISAVRRDANEHYADNLAKAYMTDYVGRGFARDDRPVPEAVTNALHLPSEIHVRDPVTGSVWERNPKGEFTRTDKVDLYTVEGPVSVNQTTTAKGEGLARLNQEHQNRVQSNRHYAAESVRQKYQDMQQQQQQHQPTPSQPAPQAHGTAHQTDVHAVPNGHDKTRALTAETAATLPVHASRKETTDHMLAALLSDDPAAMHAGIAAGLNTHASQQALQHANHVAAQADPAKPAQNQPAPQEAPRLISKL